MDSDRLNLIISDHHLVSVGEYAGKYGVSPQTVRRYIREGRLAAVPFGPRQFRLDPDDMPAREPIGRSGTYNGPDSKRLK